MPRAAGQRAVWPLSRQLRGGHLAALLPSTHPSLPPHLPFFPTLVTSPCHRVPDIFYDQAFIFLKVKTEQNKKYEEMEHLQDRQEARPVGLG